MVFDTCISTSESSMQFRVAFKEWWEQGHPTDLQTDLSSTPTANQKMNLQETGKPPKNGTPPPPFLYIRANPEGQNSWVVLKAAEKSRRTGKIIFPQCQSFQSLYTCATSAVSMQSPAETQLPPAQIICFFQGLLKSQSYLFCYYVFQNREVRNLSGLNLSKRVRLSKAS